MTDPREYVAAETLKGGLPVTVRALRPDDRERVAAAIRALDRESIYFRLFSYRRELTEAGLDRVMRFDPEKEIALVVTVGSGAGEKVIGSGRYVVGDPKRAEIAFMVEEDYHGRGIASRLLRHLALIARGHGIEALEADVLAENKAMLAVFARTGWKIRSHRDGGTVHVTLALPTDPALL